MKQLLTKSIAVSAISFVAIIGSADAGHPVYPPLGGVRTGDLVFEDSDNAERLKNCGPRSAVCATYYILPRYIDIKTNEETGAKMVSHGLMMPSHKPSRLTQLSVYNITFQPSLKGIDDLREQLHSSIIPQYANRNSISYAAIRPDQIMLSPLPIADTQFIVTGLPNGDLFTTDEDLKTDSPAPVTDPETKAPLLSSEEVQAKAEQIARSVRFTEFYAPKWTGDVHSLGQPFSVSIQGRSWNIEPAFKHMMTSSAGNGVIGTMSFRFRALAVPLKVTLSCNLKTFQEVVESTTKSWNIYRYSSPFKTVERFNNDEWNAVKASLKVTDFCSVLEIKDSTLTQDDALNQIRDLLFNKLLDRAFSTVVNAKLPDLKDGTDPKYTTYESRASIDAQAKIDLSIEERRVVWFSSDLDFQGGAISKDQLDPSHWRLCNHWARPNPRTNTCEDICEPDAEVYWKGHPKAKIPQDGTSNLNVCVAYEDL